MNLTNSRYHQVDLSLNYCECDECCSIEFISLTTPWHEDGITRTPEGGFYSLSFQGIFEIDPITGAASFYFGPIPNNLPDFEGFVGIGGGIFYTISDDQNLYEINTNTGIISNLGGTGFSSSGDITAFNGEYYFTTQISSVPLIFGIVRLDINNPVNSSLIITIGNYQIVGLSASPFCNKLVGTGADVDNIVIINLVDGSIMPQCATPDDFWYITSMQEFIPPAICDFLDLDCDDSSGAVEGDYNSIDFDCLSNPVPITDNDVGLLNGDPITEITVHLNGFIPDAPLEFLLMNGTIPNINVTGAGTDLIVLSNGGGASSKDFGDALKLITYNNSAVLPTAGLRTIEVQFTTESGSMSNVATAFIQVNELPLVEVDLGPDQEACEGETATFDAGNPGADYEWSTGATSQTITVDEEDQYIVTVSDGINCPNQDTVELDILPVIHIALAGDTEICDNVQANLTLNTDATFPIDVEITSDPGSPFTLSGITGNYTFTDLISDDTEYTITNVTSSQPACIEITDPEQIIDVNPSYIHAFDASICDGDSIWLGFYWETEAGVYENSFNTFDGCDSVVTTTLNVSNAINISNSNTTCDSAQAGVFITHLNNPNGCDTIVTTTITLLPSDTTYQTSFSCNLSSTGVFTQQLINQQGCDSLVITTVSWIPPIDTTTLFQTSCDSAQTGVFQQVLADQSGCDSLVITTISIGPSDTTYLFGASCDITMIGVSQTTYNNQQGCDSLVITTIAAGIPDTTYLNTTSCDSANLGVFEENFVSQSGCDSTVFTTITYSATDSTFIQSTSCDPDDVGVFIAAFINTFGCDSIVTNTVSLLPVDETFISSTTCDPSAAGVFVENLTNQYGCDSIVTQTVTLLPSDETFLSSTTCMSSEAGTFISTYQNQYGCDSTVTLTVTLVPADTTILSYKTCDPSQVGNNANTYTNQNGCDSLVIQQTILHDLPGLQFTTSDYNGYGISCMGETDGSIALQVSGTSPFEYIWSTHATTQSLTGLSAGAYAVTVTDGNGCNTSTEIILFEPEPFSIGFEIAHPDCFDANAGSITVQQTGGIEPVRYSIDGINYQPSPVFENLTGGMYEITAIDANECETKEILLINVPLMVNVNLGEDMQFFPGDTAVIHAIVNVPYDSLASVQWSGLNNTNCPTCLTQTVTPIITTTYTVSVTTHDGCADEDALTLFVENENDVYVPNIFSPDGDGVNDVIVISAGSSVEQILEFVVFDRWGNVVYADDHFEANDVSHAWDGRMKEKELNPGVFAYKVIVQFANGQQDIIFGDITLIR